MKKVLITFAFVSIAAIGYFTWASTTWFHFEFPDVGILKTRFPTIVYQGSELPTQVRLDRGLPKSWVRLTEISQVAVSAVIVSEDWAFYRHPGYDLNQIREAMKEDWEEGRFARGASTITQQVVRNVFLTKEKHLWRKLKELYLSIQLEKKIGKRRILETYLNIAEWGEGIYGIGPASHFYFNKSPLELTAKEGAFLAMLLPSPHRYSQSFRNKHLTDYARETVNSILDKMVQAKYLTEEERAREEAQPLSFESEALPSPPTDPPS